MKNPVLVDEETQGFWATVLVDEKPSGFFANGVTVGKNNVLVDKKPEAPCFCYPSVLLRILLLIAFAADYGY